MLKQIYVLLQKFFPPMVLENIFLHLYGVIKIPLIAFVKARLIRFDQNCAVIKIPLCRRTKNHLNSVYFGALAIGADLTGGVIALQEILLKSLPVSFVFKDFHADFLKRAEGDVYFTCTQVAEINRAVASAMASGERTNIPFDVIATVPSKFGDDPIAKFHLTLSIKKRT